MTQKQLVKNIYEEMTDMGYIAIPDLNNIGELQDITGWDIEKKKAYFQNLTKLGLEQAFERVLKEMVVESNKTQENG